MKLVILFTSSIDFKQITERYSILFYAMYPWLKILISFTTFKSFLSLTIMQLINYACIRILQIIT